MVYLIPGMRKAFTLIEIIIVMLIIGILAILVTSTYMNIKAQAKIAQDDSLIAALQTSLNTQHLQNKINHLDSSYDGWPRGDIFKDLLESPPPYLYTTISQNPPRDGRWFILDQPALGYIHIYCSHYDSTWPNPEGRRYIYMLNANDPTGQPQGTIYKKTDWGHK